MTTLGSQRASSVHLAIPGYGTARANVVFETGAAPAAGPATLTMYGLVMAGTIVRPDIDAPDLPHAVWVNGAGWDAPLPARSYYSANGVRVATVLRDLATDTGEVFAVDPAVTVGTATVGHWYARRGSTPTEPSTGRQALLTLWRLGYVPPWWVDGQGRTNFGTRPGGAAVGRADVMRRDASVGLRVFGCDDPAGFLPGTTLEGVTTRRLVVKETGGGALVGEAWG